MAFGDDEDILQDFLVEAGEIIEQLSEQLVDLEQRPDDKDLLNAIFRGFHTVKGGAGFLQLNAMVDCCHATENLFDILRNGQQSVTPELMDVVLQALDAVNGQFAQVSAREEPEPADPVLLEKLHKLSQGESLSETADPEPPVAENEAPETSPDEVSEPQATNVQTPEEATSNSAIDLTDDEFESLLDAISDTDESSAAPSEPSSDFLDTTSEASAGSGDEITEDEFEALLDQLHGAGKGPGAGGADTGTTDSDADKGKKAATAATTSPGVDLFDEEPDASVASSGASADGSSGSSTDEITEDEFEKLLDQLHGSGKAPGKPPVEGTTAPAASASAKPENTASDLITDDEFEHLLDELHGKGRGPSDSSKAAGTEKMKQASPEKPAASPTPASSSAKPVSAAPSAPAPAPAPKPKPAQTSQAQQPSRVEVPSAPSRSLAPKPREGGQGAAPAAETTVRVDTQRLDDIMNMVGELVLVRNRLVRLGLESSDESMQKAVANLDVVTADLQSSVMKTRMQPIKKVFGRFPRVVRDLARNLKKEINLELQGEDTDLDKNLVEALADPLVHLVRNSVDHGIEMPTDREAKGKSRVGKVTLAAEQEGDHILLSITDDGAGMDPDKLRAKAIEKGLLDADSAARITDSEAFNLIFAPGFSTKQEISDVSGRGVGMDVVKTKITQLNGSVEIFSKIGEGTSIRIKVPLTLAIMPTLMIMLGEQTFALPLVSVNEIFHMDLTKSNIVDGQECITIREKAIPIFHLKRWLVKKNVSYDVPHEGHIVIVSVGTQRVGFVVDQLIGQEEVVIKPLGKMLHGTPGMAGATITGDGTIALILDVPSMLKRYVGNT